MTDKCNVICLRASQQHFQDVCALTKVGFQFDLSTVKQNPAFKYDNWFVLYHQQRALASGCITDVICHVDGADLATAAVGLVTTHPDERGKGYGLQLMHKLVTSACEDGYDISLVFPWLESWYAKVGYTSIHASYRKITLETLRNADCSGYRVRSFQANRDAEAIVQIHQFFSQRLSGPLNRGCWDWTGLVESRGQITVAERAGVVVAYLVCKPLDANNKTGPYGLKVREFGCWEGCEQGVDALFCAQAGWLEAAGFAEIYYEDLYSSSLSSVVCEPPYQQLDDNRSEITRMPDQFMVQMYRLLSLKSVLRKLTESWNRRLGSGICWQDIFEIESRQREFCNIYTVRFIKSGAKLELNERDFLSLFVLAAQDWKSAQFQWAPTCTDWENQIMTRLLPSRRFVYWDTDCF